MAGSERQHKAVEDALAREDAERRAKNWEAARQRDNPPPPAGWYAHPTMANTRRYWDGEAWTDHIAPMDRSTRSGARDNDNADKLTVVAFVLAIIFPIGGFVAGAVLLSKRAGVGAAAMMLSVVAGYVWYDLYVQEQQTDCAIANVDRAIEGLPPLDCG